MKPGGIEKEKYYCLREVKDITKPTLRSYCSVSSLKNVLQSHLLWMKKSVEVASYSCVISDFNTFRLPSKCVVLFELSELSVTVVL